ncbi:MAG TPA: hypothetical protein VND45_07975 [Thermoanaerobaculia bacterium]|jgi:hypothetical protein|nr:hypothetical protein [Thermoanaerobaculia bacterium]
MIRRIALSLLLSFSAFAQGVDATRNVSGTTPGTGASPWVRTGTGRLTLFHGFDIHVTHLTQTGPEEQETATFSTNWFGAGAQYELGQRAFVLARGRVSLEPYTIEEEGYAQFFQYVPEEGLVNRMRGQDLLGEAAVQVGFRPTNGSLLSVYGALVGHPAFGAAPAQLRSSGVDFAEAPFGYEIQETVQDSTSVVTAGFATRFFTVEGSMFHDTFLGRNDTDLETGDMDSRSARLTVTPTPNLALQVSRAELLEGDIGERDMTSASLTYGGGFASITAQWMTREFTNFDADAQTSYGLEVALRASRNTFMARVEHIDRPAGFLLTPTVGLEEATHYTAGYVFDVLPRSRYKLGVGVNIDYRTKTRELEDVYGHKPQGIYTFVRFRT